MRNMAGKDITTVEGLEQNGLHAVQKAWMQINVQQCGYCQVGQGTLDQAIFDRITTHADGAVGVQTSKPVGRLAVRRGIETFGGTGESLVKGVVTTLSAIGRA